MILSNLARHWRSADQDAVTNGLAWYREAGRLVRCLAAEFGTTRSVVAGVLSAVSPRQPWSRNLAVARGILSGGPVTGVFRTNVLKARRILGGERPLAVLRGNKVRAFYRALLGDRSAVVVDTWIVRAAGLRSTARLTDGLYNKIADALRALARQLRVAAADLQATIWVTIRGRHT